MKHAALLFASLVLLPPLAVLAQDSGDYSRLGRAKFEQKDYEGAAEYWQKALAGARDAKDPIAAARLSRDLGDAFLRQGEAKKAQPFLQDALAAYPAGTRDHVDALILMGWVRVGTDENDRAMDDLGKALESARALNDFSLERRCHAALGSGRRHRKEFGKALEHLRRARELARLLDDAAAEKDSLDDLGWLYQEMDRLEDSEKTFTELVEFSRKKGDREHEVASLSNLGYIYFSTGAYAKARGFYAEEVQAALKLGGKAEEASARRNLAVTLLKLGEFDAAAAELQDALKAANASGKLVNQTEVLRSQGGVSEAVRDWSKAFSAYEEALRLSTAGKNVREERRTLEELARLSEARQDLVRAEGYQERLLELARNAKNLDRERTALKKLGELHFNRTDYSGAKAFHEQMVSLSRTSGDPKSEAAALLMLALDSMVAGDKQGATDRIQESLKIWRRLGNKGAEIQALQSFGASLIGFGEYRKGLDTLDQAMALIGPDGPPDQKAVLLGFAADGWTGLGDHQKSLEALLEARKFCHEARAPRDEAEAALRVGKKLQDLGRGRDAFNLYKEAEKLAAEAKDPELVKKALTEMGDMADDSGDANAAGGFYLQALEAVRPWKLRKAEASALVNLGSFFQRTGELGRALEYFQEALALQKTSGDRVAQLVTTGNAGNLFASLGDYDKAREHFQQALALAKDLGDLPNTAILLNNIGDTYRRQDDLAAALEHFQQSVEIAQKVERSTWSAQSHIAGVYLEQGKLEEAREIYQRIDDPLGLGMYGLRAGKDRYAFDQFLREAKSARRSSNAERLVASLTGGAMALERLGNVKEARNAYDQAIAKLEEQRDALPAAARSHFFLARSEFLPRMEAYEGRARVAADAREGFFWSENTKSRLFIESLAAGEAAVDKLPKDLAKAEAKGKAFQAWLLKEDAAARQAKDSARLKKVEEDMASAKKEQAAFITRLRREMPQYAAAQYPQPMPPEQISLENDEALLEFEVTASSTLIFIVRADHKVFTVGVDAGRAELRRLVAAFRKPFENPLDAGGRFAGGYDLDAGARLYELLLRRALTVTDSSTMVSVIPTGARLIIVPDEMLGLLPFEALPINPVRKTQETWRTVPGPKGIPVLLAPKGGGFVGEDYDITYAQSATALTLSRALRHGRGKGGMFVLADPIFDRSDPRLKGKGLEEFLRKDELAQVRRSVSQTLMGVQGTRGGTGAALPRLEDTGALARRLERAFGGDVASFTGLRASEATVRQQDLARYRHLIFATHGLLASDLPYLREPALVMSQVRNEAGEDGFLTMSEVMGLKLQADVVALTACKTGIGRELSGEGVMGLGRGFQYAGARAVMVSLWSVAEESTTLLTEDFFKTVRGGKLPREALRQARRNIRGAGYDHPFFWAPFILVGQ